jgi:hypothetical protein
VTAIEQKSQVGRVGRCVVNLRTIAVWIRLLGLASACAGAAAGCSNGEPQGGYGQAKIQVSLRASSAPTVSRMTVTVRPGDGPAFTEMVVELPKSGDSWGGFVTGIPAGPGRLFDVAALAEGGQALFTGSGKADISPGGVIQLAIVLQQVPGNPFGNSIPVIDTVSASAAIVKPGDTVRLGVSAHDPDVGDSLSYRWAASSGTFDPANGAETRWTAPDLDAKVIELVITVSDDRGGSASASMKVMVARGRTVSGSRLVSYWQDATSSLPAPDVAVALPPRAILHAQGAWVEHAGGTLGTDGTFVEGAFGKDGTYVIPDVPEGSYVLCYDPPSAPHVCTDTFSDSVDLGYDVLGRPDQARATRGTPVTLSLSGLDPWNPIREQVQITSSGANLWDVAAPGISFRGGDTSGTVVEDWSRANVGGGPLGLLVSTDSLLVHQLSTRSIYVNQAITFYAAATRAAVAPATALTDGQAASISVTLEALPITGRLPVAWDPATFESHLSSLAPDARRSMGAAPHALRVGASATPLDRTGPGVAGGFPSLLRLELPSGAGPISDTLYYGHSLPASWSEWRSARFSARVSYLAAGATLPLVEESTVERRDPVPAPDGALGPSVSPPRSPKVNDLDAFADQTAVGTTPKLSWLAPKVGAPTTYVVELYRLVASGKASASSLVLRYSTTATSVTIPPRVLEAGATYYARISARVSRVAYDTAPLRTSDVESVATALTGTFAP